MPLRLQGLTVDPNTQFYGTYELDASCFVVGSTALEAVLGYSRLPRPQAVWIATPLIHEVCTEATIPQHFTIPRGPWFITQKHYVDGNMFITSIYPSKERIRYPQGKSSLIQLDTKGPIKIFTSVYDATIPHDITPTDAHQRIKGGFHSSPPVYYELLQFHHQSTVLPLHDLHYLPIPLRLLHLATSLCPDTSGAIDHDYPAAPNTTAHRVPTISEVLANSISVDQAIERPVDAATHVSRLTNSYLHQSAVHFPDAATHSRLVNLPTPSLHLSPDLLQRIERLEEFMQMIYARLFPTPASEQGSQSPHHSMQPDVLSPGSKRTHEATEEIAQMTIGTSMLFTLHRLFNKTTQIRKRLSKMTLSKWKPVLNQPRPLPLQLVGNETSLREPGRTDPRPELPSDTGPLRSFPCASSARAPQRATSELFLNTINDNFPFLSLFLSHDISKEKHSRYPTQTLSLTPTTSQLAASCSDATNTPIISNQIQTLTTQQHPFEFSEPKRQKSKFDKPNLTTFKTPDTFPAISQLTSIYIRLPNGSLKLLQLHRITLDSKIAQLLEQIKILFNALLPNSVRFTFAGQTLNPHHTIKHYRLTNDSILTLTVAIRGGTPICRTIATPTTHPSPFVSLKFATFNANGSLRGSNAMHLSLLWRYISENSIDILFLCDHRCTTKILEFHRKSAQASLHCDVAFCHSPLPHLPTGFHESVGGTAVFVFGSLLKYLQ